MFEKVLVVNRGEIALRLLRTLREMSISSVAVYSDADLDSPHWRLADEAYALGSPEPAASYLNVDKLLHIAERCGAQAVLPGYGFLSENASFARACEERGLVFVGPPANLIEQMGSKQLARETMQRAGVPVVPGGSANNVDEARATATAIGYPVLVKAVYGGGGRGMRLVQNDDELQGALQLATSEAARAFGSGDVYLEKWVAHARHIEVQVLGDQHGNVVHLFERDCSIQRRHQKVLEETPSPGLDEAVRERLLATAVSGASAVGYSSAGTFEFLLAPDGQFYFIEMNTRLQVEHTVTEMVTGIDLVEMMLRVAAGERLNLSQEQIERHGHALQCRLCAEDPAQGFRPSTGVIQDLEIPSGPFVRFDGGLCQGQAIGSHYDSLLGKLCVWAPSRRQLLSRMQRALGECRISGLETNVEFCRRVVEESDFANGAYDTGYIEQHSELARANEQPSLAALAALLVEQHVRRTTTLDLQETPLSAWLVREPAKR